MHIDLDGDIGEDPECLLCTLFGLNQARFDPCLSQASSEETSFRNKA